MLLVEEKAYSDSVLPEKSFLTISSDDGKEEMKRKFAMWKGK